MTRTSALTATTLSPMLVALLLARSALSQTAPPQDPSAYPGGAPPAPGAPTAQPPWTYNPNQAQAPAPSPGPAPAAQGPAPAAPYPGQPGAAPGNQPPAGWTAPSQPAPEPSAPPVEEPTQERVNSLQEHNSMFGSSGLLHTVAASSGAAGTFRLHFLLNWFQTSSFLCDASHVCIVPNQGSSTDSDSATNFGANIGLSITPVDFLEAYATIRSISNSNSRAQPQLLQVLGDTMIGAKVFTPNKLGQTFDVGGSVDMLFLNGAGSVGLDSGATSFRLKALATADLRQPGDGGVPLRLHLNLGYFFDNSASLVENVENQRTASNDVRGPRVTRVERFGLGINRVDQMLFSFGVEGMFPVVRPFIEWNLGIATNRQGYACDPARASAVGDTCLHDASFSGMPSTLTLGLRAYPFLKGLEALAAFDIGTSGTSSFVEELAPTPPWNLWLGLGFAFDAQEPVAPKPQVVVVNGRSVERHIRGLVHEKDKADAVANAIVRFEGRDLTGLASGPDGRFISSDLEPGNYTLNIHADGYIDGKCAAVVLAGAPLAPPPGPAPAAANPWAPPPNPGTAPSPAPASPGGATSSSGPFYFDVDCPLEAAPRGGSIKGSAVDAETNGPVNGLAVRIIDTEGKEVAIATDPSGAFHVEQVQPGTVTIKADADGYMLHVQTVDVRARDESHVTMQMNKRPKRGDVEIAGNEIRIKKQIHFEVDSAVISLDSTALLEEIADTMNRNPCLKAVEIQGHTDNTGSKEHNKVLSDQRANSVREWLLGHGVEPGRLTAQGYGQDRPISPNITPAGKERNRRVQFIIKDQDKNCGKGAGPSGAAVPANPAAPRPAAPAAPPPSPPKPAMPF
jgi:outer membrane protein OmpA-like peptidoglycan-associated protein